MDPFDLPRRPPLETAERYARIRHEIHLFERDATDGKPGLSLSHWVDWEMWQRVKEYFVEVEEGDWVCGEENADAVEAALEILPENHWKTIRDRKAAEQAQADPS